MISILHHRAYGRCDGRHSATECEAPSSTFQVLQQTLCLLTGWVSSAQVNVPAL